MKLVSAAVALSFAVAGCASVHHQERGSRDRQRPDGSARVYTLWPGKPLVVRSAPRFVELRIVRINDSRCPVGVPCARRGDVRVTIQARFASYGDRTWRETFTLTDRPGSRHGRTLLIGEYEFTLLDVRPHPVADGHRHYALAPHVVVSVKELRVLRFPGPPPEQRR